MSQGVLWKPPLTPAKVNDMRGEFDDWFPVWKDKA